MTTENWTEERDRLLALLSDYDAGKITRLDRIDDESPVPATTEERIAAVRQRLAALDQRLDDKDGG